MSSGSNSSSGSRTYRTANTATVNVTRDELNQGIDSVRMSLSCCYASHKDCGIVNCAHICWCRCHRLKCRVCEIEHREKK